ncbi:hypothetical protein GCM10010394_12720 [Streptomyces crystallinus]|uniref:Uncharacterized protein n=1 Tax=Streptomyces crystallinus TaxID=68191 RepID=A0ABN1F8U3_9ACTN
MAAAALLLEQGSRALREPPGPGAQAERFEAYGVVEQFGTGATGQGEHALGLGGEPGRVDVAYHLGEPVEDGGRRTGGGQPRRTGQVLGLHRPAPGLARRVHGRPHRRRRAR